MCKYSFEALIIFPSVFHRERKRATEVIKLNVLFATSDQIICSTVLRTWCLIAIAQIKANSSKSQYIIKFLGISCLWCLDHLCKES